VGDALVRQPLQLAVLTTRVFILDAGFTQHRPHAFAGVVADLSIFGSPTASFGVASGELDFEVLPRQGEIVSFAQLISLPAIALPRIDGFSFQLRVANVIHAPRGGSFSIMVLLEPAVMRNGADAAALAEYLERGFGLGVDPF